MAWPLIKPVYISTFCTLGTMLFGKIGKSGHIQFHAYPVTEEKSEADLRIIYFSQKQIEAAQSATRSGNMNQVTLEAEKSDIIVRTVGYLPTILLLAFIFASPVTWQRKISAGVGGLLLVHGFILVKLWLYLLNLFSAMPEWGVVVLSPAMNRFLEMTTYVMFYNIGTSVAVPVLIWLAVTFERRDLLRLSAATSKQS